MNSSSTSKTTRFASFVSRRQFMNLTFAGVSCAALLVFPGKVLAQESQNLQLVTDCLGRKLEIPFGPLAVSPTGTPAQTLLTILAPDMMYSVATKISNDAYCYANAGLSKVTNLPETDSVTRSSYEETARKLKAIAPTLIIDAGSKQEELYGELDLLQNNLSVPVFFVDISFGQLPEALRTLGAVLGCSDRASELAQWVERALLLSDFSKFNATNTPTVFYAPRENGTMVHHGINVQLDALIHAGAIPVTSAYNFDSASVDFNSLLAEHPDFIMFDDVEMLRQLRLCTGDGYKAWCELPAITKGYSFISPALMHSWLGSPVFVQCIGALWLANMIHPKECSFDLIEETRDFYSLFYGLELDSDSLNGLVGMCLKEREGIDFYE